MRTVRSDDPRVADFIDCANAACEKLTGIRLVPMTSGRFIFVDLAQPKTARALTDVRPGETSVTATDGDGKTIRIELVSKPKRKPKRTKGDQARMRMKKHPAVVEAPEITEPT